MIEEPEMILAAASSSCGVRFHECAGIPVSSLVFSPELLKLCETNACGCYNRSWTCPPASGSYDEQRQKIIGFKNAFVFTTKHDLDDSFDYEAMTLGRDRHTLLTLEFRDRMPADFLIFGAGSCPFCKDENGKEFCAYPDPCPFPEKKLVSIEAAGINVTELSRKAGIAYNNGINTVTYFSMLICN